MFGHDGRGQEKPGNVGEKKLVRDVSINFEFAQGKINFERICNLKKKYLEKLFCIEKIFDGFLALLAFLTKLNLKGEIFM